ncbi:MAG: hypothetical protein R3F59_04710 [Myxococcota bacterium]
MIVLTGEGDYWRAGAEQIWRRCRLAAPDRQGPPPGGTVVVAAAGVTLPAGLFEIPVHLAWVSAADGWGRVIATTGVNWGAARLDR